MNIMNWIPAFAGMTFRSYRQLINRIGIRYAIPIAVLILAGFRIAPAPGADPKHIDPSVIFSEDEQTVTVRYAEDKWTFVRPVVSLWSYKEVGTVFMVAQTGDDRNKGSYEKPFKTIGRGIEQAAPGDIIYVRAGTYVESLLLKKSGEENKPIILSCAPGELGRVIITPPREYVQKNQSGAVVTLHNVRHVWVNGLVIKGPKGRPEAPKSETFGANGITWENGAGMGCRATNNVIYGNVHCGLKEMGHGGTNILMEGNVVFGNGTNELDHGIYCPANDLTINGNIIFNNAGFAIHSYSRSERQVITRNLCISNNAGGILLAGGDNKVFHNICAFNTVGIYYFRGSCSDNIVKNNIFAFNKTDCGYDNGGGKLGDPAGNLDDYNCYFPGKPEVDLRPGEHEVLADPQFVDAGKGNYGLKKDSPCRAKGIDVGLSFQHEAPDIGAFSSPK
jgi:hypothetical protein